MAGPTVYSRLRTTDFSRNFSWPVYLLSRVFARNLLRGNRRRNTCCILFWSLTWGSNPGFMSNKPIHCLLDYGDFIESYKYCQIRNDRWLKFKPIDGPPDTTGNCIWTHLLTIVIVLVCMYVVWHVLRINNSNAIIIDAMHHYMLAT